MKTINNTLTVLGRSTSLKSFCEAVQATRKDKSITGKKAISLNSVLQFRLSEILDDEYYSYEMLISIVTRIGAYTQSERKQRETNIIWKYSNIASLKKSSKGELVVITSTDNKLPNGFFKGLQQFGYGTIEAKKESYYEYKILTLETVKQHIESDLQKQRQHKTSLAGGKIIMQKTKETTQKSVLTNLIADIERLKADNDAMAKKLKLLV